MFDACAHICLCGIQLPVPAATAVDIVVVAAAAAINACTHLPHKYFLCARASVRHTSTGARRAAPAKRMMRSRARVMYMTPSVVVGASTIVSVNVVVFFPLALPLS